MSDINETVLGFASAIKKRRQQLGITQIELADLAGVSSSFIHNLENGKATVALDRMLLVISTLGLCLKLEIATNE